MSKRKGGLEVLVLEVFEGGDSGDERSIGAVGGRDICPETEPGTGSGATAAVGPATERRWGERMDPSVQPQKVPRRRKPLGQRKKPHSFIQPERENPATLGNTNREFVRQSRTAQNSSKQGKTLAAQGLQGFFIGGDCWTRTSDLLRVKQAL